MIASYSGLREECEVKISTSHPIPTHDMFTCGGRASIVFYMSNQLSVLYYKKVRLVRTRGGLYTMDVSITCLPDLYSFAIGCFIDPTKACCIGPNMLICSPHIPHVIQNSWQSLCDLSHSGNYIAI